LTEASSSERVGIGLGGLALAILIAFALAGGSRGAASARARPPEEDPRTARPAPLPQATPVALATLALPEAMSMPAAAPAPRAAAAPPLPVLPFQEAHWQGLELIPMTPLLAKSLGLPDNARGVIIDEATMPADAAGFIAGDLVTSVRDVPTPDLESFIQATARVRNRHRIAVQILRKDKPLEIVLSGMFGRLGTANGETAQTIPPGSRPPHGDQGPCTNCHRIGTKGQLPVDQGDLLAKTAPTILAGQTPPHGARGTCSACHKIVQPMQPGAR